MRAGPNSVASACSAALVLALASAAVPIYREKPSGKVSSDSLTMLHITDIHADPFYDVSKFGCGVKAATRNVSLQDAKGKPVTDECAPHPAPVESICGPNEGDPDKMQLTWRSTISPGPRCPCGVAFSNPPYSIVPPLRAAIEEFAKDGYGSKTIIYTGDLAGHYMPGTSIKLNHDGCTTAHAVVKSTIDMVNVPGIEHFFVLGNNDVIPKGTPLSSSWLEDIGAFLRDRNWLTDDELATWNVGGFFWRQIHESGLCAIGLNSNHWTPTQVNVAMRDAQRDWLPGILERKGETSVCTKGFFIVSHIGLVAPGDEVRGGVTNPELWGTDKTDPVHVRELRNVLDAHADAIVSEIAGDLNKEHIYATGYTGKGSWGFTAVGVSPRGGNDAGFQRFFMTADASEIVEIESYSIKRGCEFELEHSFVDDYGPHLDGGITREAVDALLADKKLDARRAANVAPNAAGITKEVAAEKGYAEKVRKGEAGCLPPRGADGGDETAQPRAASAAGGVTPAASLAAVGGAPGGDDEDAEVGGEAAPAGSGGPGALTAVPSALGALALALALAVLAAAAASRYGGSHRYGLAPEAGEEEGEGEGEARYVSFAEYPVAQLAPGLES